MKKFLSLFVSLVFIFGACDKDAPLVNNDPVSFKISGLNSYNNKWGVLKIRNGLLDDTPSLAKGEGHISNGEITFVLKDYTDQSLNWHKPGKYYLTAEIYQGNTVEKTYLYVDDKADELAGWDDINKVPKFVNTESKTYSVSSDKFKDVTDMIAPVSFKISGLNSYNNKWGVLKIRNSLLDDTPSLAKGEGHISNGEITFVLKDYSNQNLNWKHKPGEYYLTAEIYQGNTLEKTYLYVDNKADEITGSNDIDKVPKFVITGDKTYSVASDKFKDVTSMMP